MKKAIELKINSKIKELEWKVKKYRMETETFLEQFIVEGNNNFAEVKWNRLSTLNKKFLIDNLTNYGQINTSITSNLKKWITKKNRKWT